MFHAVAPGGRCSRSTPQLCEALEAVAPYVTVLSAKFSVVEPGTRIRSHCGPANNRWKLHLGVVVPKEDIRPSFCDQNS